MAFGSQPGARLPTDASASLGAWTPSHSPPPSAGSLYRDLIQASLMLDARFLALAVPIEYRYGNRPSREPSYAKTYSVVEAVYGSPRLNLPFDGLLLIGY